MARGKHRHRAELRAAEHRAAHDAARAEREAKRAAIEEAERVERARAVALAEELGALQARVDAVTADAATALEAEVSQLEEEVRRLRVSYASKKRNSKQLARVARMEGYLTAWDLATEIIGEVIGRDVYMIDPEVHPRGSVPDEAVRAIGRARRKRRNPNSPVGF